MKPPEKLYQFLEKKYKKKFVESRRGSLIQKLQFFQKLFKENTRENDAILEKFFST